MSEPVQAAGLYVHVPFCERKCPYCSFFSIAEGGNRELQQRYVRAARIQMERLAAGAGEEEISRPRTVDTIFFGGGTPAVLPVHLLADLLSTSLELFDTPGESLEVSLEVNPGTVDRDDLLSLRRAGFNRISIGVQSLDDGELRRLGRIHDRAQAEQTVTWARQAGFSNLSLDLMFGLPGQDLCSWRRTLEQALALKPDHLSIYELTLEENTSFYLRARQGDLHLPPEEIICEMMEWTQEQTAAAGLRRYEISNYARPGVACRHNLKYWDNSSYIGIGPGAVSFLANTRMAAIEDVAAYCRLLLDGGTGDGWRRVWVDSETLDRQGRFRETVIMGLRLVRGVSRTRLQERFGLDIETFYGPVLERLREAGLVEWAGEYLRLTPAGLRLANTVMAELV
ncbi:coproporphyrinogen III oxidase [Desulfolithobacter dissulfuricans]|uniref:Heme chaperone HemW n=1 Tax=Desulfolithobacter dissulfuricans TaxID=2795293 RepID=A0A915XJS8_9BACT|nr:radical SAM family heme chaperone HemW [Desulfolithobacter dissulfuricans]BCO10720.1 coproporphyrinogen III oxidase [Desulfolithobacter dissulfuricans]